ncbi:Metallo-dependent phosphatase-like protein [Syncephalis fuscata]|nr:Metallo-dependent phosphatase-like protein [Syncephalis fuscata]
MSLSATKDWLGQISNVIEWDDASHLSFRPASELAKRRVVAVGDLHGDFANSLNVFKMANIIDEEGHWAGGNYTVFVQTGDIVDRGHDTIALYTFMRRLKTEASNAGGRVVQLLGNHELMNVANDLRYVTTEDYASFGGPYERQKAFSQYGSIGSRLFKLHLVHRVGDTVFTHGGINEEWAQHGVRKTNRDTTKGLPPYIAETDMYQRYYGWPIFGDEGPAWYRGYALHAEDYICRSLYRALKKLNVKRMVVGHTWQQSGRVLSRCNNRFFVIDIGISAVYGRFQGALEIDPSGQVTALYPKGPETLVQPPTKTL